MKAVEHMMDEERLRDMTQPEEEKGKYRSYCYLQIPNQDYREARLFLEVHSGRGTENRFEYGKSLLDTQVFNFFFFFTTKAVKYWNSLHREVAEFPFLGTFKTQLDMAMSNQL